MSLAAYPLPRDLLLLLAKYIPVHRLVSSCSSLYTQYEGDEQLWCNMAAWMTHPCHPARPLHLMTRFPLLRRHVATVVMTDVNYFEMGPGDLMVVLHTSTLVSYPGGAKLRLPDGEVTTGLIISHSGRYVMHCSTPHRNCLYKTDTLEYHSLYHGDMIAILSSDTIITTITDIPKLSVWPTDGGAGYHVDVTEPVLWLSNMSTTGFATCGTAVMTLWSLDVKPLRSFSAPILRGCLSPIVYAHRVSRGILTHDTTGKLAIINDLMEKGDTWGLTFAHVSPAYILAMGYGEKVTTFTTTGQSRSLYLPGTYHLLGNEGEIRWVIKGVLYHIDATP